MPAIAFAPNLVAILTGVVWLILFAWLISIVLTVYGLSRQRPLLPTNHLRMRASDAPLIYESSGVRSPRFRTAVSNVSKTKE